MWQNILMASEQQGNIPADKDDSLSHAAEALVFCCVVSRTCFSDTRFTRDFVDDVWSIDECRE